jgi:hypothetical protein
MNVIVRNNLIAATPVSVLFGAAMLFAMLSTASAKQINLPPEMHGLWCEQLRLDKSKYVEHTTTTYDRFSCKFAGKDNNEEGRINVGPDGFSASEYTCRIVSGSVVSSKYTLTLSCMETPQETWRIKIRIYLVQNGPTRSAHFRWSSLVIEEL